MIDLRNKPFDVKLQHESNYYRLYVTHQNFKGRIRKRLGDKPKDDLDSIAYDIKFALGRHFIDGDFDIVKVEEFIDNYVAMHVKCTASIFDYNAEFLEFKEKRVNKRTKNNLAKSTISGYRTALKYFEEFLIKRRIEPHPSRITEAVLNDFYSFINGMHNYKVKLHTKIKGFMKFLVTIKKLPVDPSYLLSVFTEQYDNQCPEDDDRALTEEDVYKLIVLRKKLQHGEIHLERYAKSNKIPAKLQEQQLNLKLENLTKCLDCFLLMTSTGMYYADIMKSKLFFSEKGSHKHARYRRAKNGSLCKAIPISDEGIFIGAEIIQQYKIQNGTSFPLKLSLTHFDKHLDRISVLADIGYKITNKMARKTFASTLHFNKNLPINYLQILLGHKNVKDTYHYLRINDDDVANEIVNWISLNSNKK